ncbi:MAG: hypothetical protein DWQ47_03360 [Acidobacteria bacterium]|nr:MAG: hypothetical protein DWQ32_06910 [Acidobacteriota bacterium]REK01441.1 MAG: hypothetical protein DWQ38_03345 [Acidobacteriota bacterium]REK14397.1 MAG: hypothetical protein DWQ43_12600 [Acidobacteriota bacterium]REK45112.1 MAG: hypothetical protein DWQ47_03360 [Acidobacteriota bacterium]
MRKLQLESFGVRLRLDFEDEEALVPVIDRLRFVFRDQIRIGNSGNHEHRFVIGRANGDETQVMDVYQRTRHPVASARLTKTIESMVRNKIAEYAVGKVFLHAGVVSIDGEALVIPGRSRTGKSTLVNALLNHGAVYYSDEYAVIDKDGEIHPFAKPISLRSTERDEGIEEVVPEELGIEVGHDPVPCKMVLLTEFVEGGKWSPFEVGNAAGVLKLIENSVGLRTNTCFSLKVLNKLALRAIIAQSCRSEALETAIKLIEFFKRPSIGIQQQGSNTS